MSETTRHSETAPAPTTFPNPRHDDPWDNDAVQWLLLKSGASKWTRGTLFEALRRQPRLVQDHPNVVAEAARLAACFGVQQKGDFPRSGNNYPTDQDRLGCPTLTVSQTELRTRRHSSSPPQPGRPPPRPIGHLPRPLELRFHEPPESVPHQRPARHHLVQIP